MDNLNVECEDSGIIEKTQKRPVMGNSARNARLLFLAVFAVVTAVLTVLAVQFAEPRKVLLTVMAVCDAVLLALSFAVPVLSCFSNYSYALSEDGAVLYHRDEEVMTMKWAETEVSLGSFINKGSEKNPAVCAKAICFTRRGSMRTPQRFPKRALKGAAGELCIAFSKGALRDVYRFSGGNIGEDITADGCRLSQQDTELMLSALHRLKDKAAKAAAAEAARMEKEAAAQAARAEKEAAERAKQEAREARAAARGSAAEANDNSGDEL